MYKIRKNAIHPTAYRGGGLLANYVKRFIENKRKLEDNMAVAETAKKKVDSVIRNEGILPEAVFYEELAKAHEELAVTYRRHAELVKEGDHVLQEVRRMAL